MVKVDLIEGKVFFICSNGFESDALQSYFKGKLEDFTIVVKADDMTIAKLRETDLLKKAKECCKDKEPKKEEPEEEKAEEPKKEEPKEEKSEEPKKEEPKKKRKRLTKKETERMQFLREELRKVGKVFGPKTGLEELEKEYADIPKEEPKKEEPKKEEKPEDDLFGDEEKKEESDDDLFGVPEVAETVIYDSMEVKRALIAATKDEKSGVVKADVRQFLINEMNGTKLDELDQEGLAKLVAKFGLKV